MVESMVGEGDVARVKADSVLLMDVIRAVLDRGRGQRWSVRPDKAWCYVTPPAQGGASREHGWKLHVSATPLSAPLVLARAGEVLVRAGCSFKFGTDIKRVSELVDQWYPRGGSGKFITVYPKSDDQFRELAERLHEATEGLPGPAILSDKRLRPGSLVFYRYGEISGGGRSVFTDDGEFRRQMMGPDGAVAEDARNAWFSPPPWATSPFPEEPVEARKKADSILLADRYRVRSAIRHANKGGVYRAVDVRNGQGVVIKQARAHVGSSLDGTDVRDHLRQEDRILQALQPLRVAPAPVQLFEEEGHLFLVQEEIPGQTLQDWATGQAGDGPGLSPADARDRAMRLVSLVEQVHAGGYAIRDLKPANVMVLPDGSLKIIDVEFVVPEGADCRVIGTPGCMAPELKKTGMIKAGAAPDCYSLGATIFYAVTSLHPSLIAPRNGDTQEDRARSLARTGGSHPALLQFSGLIVGLTHPDPEMRWTLAQARKWLDALPHSGILLPTAVPAEVTLSDKRLEALIDDRIRLLQSSMQPDAKDLWAPSGHTDERDPCTAWNGAAGGLAALTKAAPHGSGALHETVARTAEWINQRLFTIPRLLPGLAFGRSGTAWAVYDAGRLLGDERLQARAIELAGKLPASWAIPDITQGLSGAGMTHLHLWQSTGEPALLNRALECAENVLAAASRHGDDWSWPVPETVNSRIAGLNAYGFAHGVAGAGTFLMMAAQAAEVRSPGSGARFHEAALGAGDTLMRAAVIRNEAASWPRSVAGHDPDTAGNDGGLSVSGRYWCAGAGGIGSFLIRLWAATREQRFADLAAQAAMTVTRNPWANATGACCGLVGAGHFLLDMANHTGQESYHREARAISAVIDDLTALDSRAPGRASGSTEQLDYQNGAAGELAFFLRLRHGGDHPWMPAPSTSAY
ncbi:class IV lanthionine synthetase LanL [Streptomyces sp. NPDC056534]|uniref:class IV lanthionine synthetase LanL n=1 Tax=Streptomyces sp. NPDC056534 TaxID=3345857 RepID=UPI0036B97C5B